MEIIFGVFLFFMALIGIVLFRRNREIRDQRRHDEEAVAKRIPPHPQHWNCRCVTMPIITPAPAGPRPASPRSAPPPGR